LSDIATRDRGVPAPTAAAARTSVKVRFHELDPNGHVNHGIYLTYFESARIELLEALGFGLADLRARGIHLVVVEANVRFKRPAVASDLLTIDSHVAELRRASCWWHQRMTRDGELIAEVDVRSSVVTPDGRPTRPPGDLVAALEALAV
jgi:YbgC/YbaW family acyl-CoA thioester hydrolase